jgi:hypothetical protein
MIDLSPYLCASGDRILKGVTGKVHDGPGQIWIRKAPLVGIDRHLFTLLTLSVDALGIGMSLDSIDTGRGIHTPGSRHFDGRAADCDLMGARGGPLLPATLLNRYVRRYVLFLLARGFQVGENGPHAAILWGPVGSKYNTSDKSHLSHVHTSIYRKSLPGAMEGEEEDTCGEEPPEPAFGPEKAGRGKRKGRQSHPAMIVPVAPAYLSIAFPPPFPARGKP